MMALAYSRLCIFCCFGCALCGSPMAPLSLLRPVLRRSPSMLVSLLVGGFRLLTAPQLLAYPLWVEAMVAMEVRASGTRMRASSTPTLVGPDFCVAQEECLAALQSTPPMPVRLFSLYFYLCVCVCAQSHQVTRPRFTVSLRAPRRR